MWLKFAVFRGDCCHQTETGAWAGPRSRGLSHCPSQGKGQVGGPAVVPMARLVCGEGPGLQPGREACFWCEAWAWARLSRCSEGCLLPLGWGVSMGRGASACRACPTGRRAGQAWDGSQGQS